MTTHSKRRYEQEDLFNLDTQITGIVEQPVKIVIDGKPNQVNALGLILSGPGVYVAPLFGQD